MSDHADVFKALADILRAHSAGLSIKTDTADNLYLELAASASRKKPEFFGAVQRKKSYVSYHLMPVYSNPVLLEGVSDGLKARMQGKSCFNFKAMDAVLFRELDALTQACRAEIG